ncbi:type II toxin-antitoxin system VapC family toxin [Streptomyces sp. NPDC102395]|uniref:type II toxin-antitoxin system VapC family toxin n=1 Tax=Streptomyces sp. NPDC102395 TaxID=3366168 RepID=UPI00382C886E
MALECGRGAEAEVGAARHDPYGSFTRDGLELLIQWWIISSVTLVEARDPEINQARFDYAVSRVNVVPPSEAIARHAGKLLAAAGLHGHKHALDAIAVATAVTSPAPVTILTSDPEDLLMLGGPGVRVIKV